MQKFIYQNCAKWILTGEHAVIRGGSAIAFPLLDKTMKLVYTKNDERLHIFLQHFNKEMEVLDPFFLEELKINFENFIKYIENTLNIKKINGNFNVVSNIPIKAGLGSSAALCLCMAEFLYEHFYNEVIGFFKKFEEDENSEKNAKEKTEKNQKNLHIKSDQNDDTKNYKSEYEKESQGSYCEKEYNHYEREENNTDFTNVSSKCLMIFKLSNTFENFFHFKSSGLDIATIFQKEPTIFYSKNDWKTLEMNWKPNLLLTYVECEKASCEAIKSVYNLINQNPKTSTRIDDLMKLSAYLAKMAFKKVDFGLLKESILLGYEAFNEWELITAQMENHIKMLYENGACAGKPVGSGGGGYIVSLWEKKEQMDAAVKMMPGNAQVVGF